MEELKKNRKGKKGKKEKEREFSKMEGLAWAELRPGSTETNYRNPKKLREYRKKSGHLFG